MAMRLPNTVSADLHRYFLHMNGNQDQLLAIVKHTLPPSKLPKGDLGQLIILRVTPEADGLVLVADEPEDLPPKWPKNKPYLITIPLEPPMKATDELWEIQERLTALKKAAFQRFSVDETPQVISFTRPPYFPYLIPIIALLSFQMFSTFGPAALGGDALRAWINETLGRYALRASLVVTLVTHVLEAAYMNRLCTRHSTPFETRVKYCIGTFLLGIPVMSDFGEKVLRSKVRQIYEASEAENTDAGKIGGEGKKQR